MQDYLPIHDEDAESDNAGVLEQVQTTDGEHFITLCRRIVDNHAALEIDGTIVDAWTAQAVVIVADSLNAKNRADFVARRTVIQMGSIAQKLVF